MLFCRGGWVLYGGRWRPEDEFLTTLYQLLVVVACCFLGSANLSLSPGQGGKILSRRMRDTVSDGWFNVSRSACLTKRRDSTFSERSDFLSIRLGSHFDVLQFR